jgi:hypothetical protein
MRSHSAENGDALPIIEYKALRSVAFVAEAFLFHINALEILETKISNTDDISMMDVDEVSKNTCLKIYFCYSTLMCKSISSLVFGP